MRESAINVVIPARDAASALPATLALLDGADVVVVDNASRDATAEVAAAHGARVVHEPRPSRARARNAGVAATDAPLLAFLDAGCAPHRGWLDALRACLEAGADLAGGDVRIRTTANPSPAERFDAAWRFRQARNVADGWSVTANLGCRRETFDRVDGFDEAYRHVGEDVDFCFRARAAGARLTYCSGAIVEHEAERSRRAVAKRAFWQGWSSVDHARRLPGRAGHRYWRHPRPLVSADLALASLHIDDPSLGGLARLDYAARFAGSVAATFTGRASGGA